MQIVECTINDSSDYEFVYESAINNTFTKYFEWSEENNIPVEFTKNFEDNLMHGLTLIINARFKHKEDEAQFKLTFGNKVYNRINELKMREYVFGYDN